LFTATSRGIRIESVTMATVTADARSDDSAKLFAPAAELLASFNRWRHCPVTSHTCNNKFHPRWTTSSSQIFVTVVL